MDTIETWLNQMFAPYPRSARLEEAREELRQIMEDKYDDLRASGHSEAAALGTVIAEFGDLAELAPVLGITDALDESATGENTVEYQDLLPLNTKREEYRRHLGVGVALCILAGVSLTWLGTMQQLGWISSESDIFFGINLAFTLILVASGVALLVLRGSVLKGETARLEGTEATLRAQRTCEEVARQRGPRWLRVKTICVAGFILSAIPVILASTFGDNVGAVGITITGLMVALIVGYMLTEYEYADAPLTFFDNDRFKERKESRTKRVISVVMGSYWMLVLIIFLTWSFVGDAWDHSWIVWPIAGVSFGLLAMILSLFDDEDEPRLSRRMRR